MDNIKKIQDEFKILQEEMDSINITLQNLEVQKASLLTRKQQIDQSLYKKSIIICHIQEILRLAKIHFLRLNHQKALTLEDIAELNKWVGRAKSEDGLKDIVEALSELEKYSPSDIKTNLYALVQKIIIGGAYKGRKKR